MAKKNRRSRFKFRASSRAPRYFTRRSRSRRGSSSGMGGDLGQALAGTAYGFGRSYLSDLVKPVTDKLPLGDYADNIVLGALGWALKRGKIPLLNKVKMTKDIGNAMMITEFVLLGSDIKTNMSGTKSTSSGSTGF